MGFDNETFFEKAKVAEEICFEQENGLGSGPTRQLAVVFCSR